MVAGILRETKAKVVVTLRAFPKTDVAQKVSEAVGNAPDVKQSFDANGYAVIGGTSQQFADLLKDGIKRYGEIIKAAGIKAD